MKTIAVILCGSGFKDGSEIRESVGVFWALSQHAVQVRCFAPNTPQTDVVNCLTGKTVLGENRNMLVEAARIARGEIQPLSALDTSRVDGVIIPGGFGVAKNLCTFAKEGSKGSVDPTLKKILEALYAEKKPIGAVCIAPALLALTFPGRKFELTVGGTCEVSQEIERLGHRHVVCSANDCVVDASHRVVSTPAYMDDQAPLHEIFAGIQKLSGEVVKMAVG